MSLHRLNIRCPECWIIYSVRRPNQSLLISKIVAVVKCPHCHPEALKDVCAACRLPFSVVGVSGKRHHGKGLCFSCYQRYNRS